MELSLFASAEEPAINWEQALQAYPDDAPLIEEPDWPVGGTPLGI